MKTKKKRGHTFHFFMAPPLSNLFENADHNPHYTDIESKNISITKCYCIFPVPGKKESNKRKQAEIEVKL